MTFNTFLFKGVAHKSIDGYCKCLNKKITDEWDGSKLEFICSKCFPELQNNQTELDL